MLGALYSNRSGLLLLVLGSLDAQRVVVRFDPVERPNQIYTNPARATGRESAGEVTNRWLFELTEPFGALELSTTVFWGSASGEWCDLTRRSSTHPSFT
jgi:hypothetical protein